MEKFEKLSNSDIGRYSRQMILPEIGAKGQLKLKNSSVLVVGVGGLGCPAAMYLTSSGIGKIGLLDFDQVDLSNLHRQIIHNEKSLGIPKVESAKNFLTSLNSSINIQTFNEPFHKDNALEIIKKFDIVLDCTDNPATRYLLNDSCVLTNKPLISGSALRFEGQLTTYNYLDGPCYRCIFPVPPQKEFVTNCSDGGVLGPIPGIIGTMQALECIKIICGIEACYRGKLLLFDGLTGKFNLINLRKKQNECRVCGNSPTITALVEDYALSCGSSYDDKEKGISILSSDERISPSDFKKLANNSTNSNYILIDVRDPNELDICALPYKLINIPYSQMIENKNCINDIRNRLEEEGSSNNILPVYLVCRRGNDSQRAVKLLKDHFRSQNFIFKDIIGGLHGWNKEVDSNFPIY